MISLEQILQLLEGILRGYINRKNLPLTLYDNIYYQFEESLIKGLDLPRIRELAPREMINIYGKIDGNLKRFSGAKTFQIIDYLSKMMPSKTRQEFIKDGADLINLYTKNYQQVENDLVVKQGITVQNYFEIQSQKDILPFLRYVTVDDDRVRPEHQILDGITKRVDDPFWDEFLPPNGYRCRCSYEQLEDGQITEIDSNQMSIYRKEVPLMFRNNPAKTGYIFKEDGKDKHPYFNIPPGFEGEKTRNFGFN